MNDESSHPYVKLKDVDEVIPRATALRQNPQGFRSPNRGRTHFADEEDEVGPRLPPACSRREVSDPTADITLDDSINTPMRETASERQSRRTKSQSPHRYAHDQFKPAPGKWGGMPLDSRRMMDRQKPKAFHVPVGGAVGEAFAFPNYMYCVNCGYSVTAKVAQGVGLCELCWKTAKRRCEICRENLLLKRLQWGSGLCKTCFDHAQKDCVICGIGLADSQLKWQTGMCDSCYDNYEKECSLCASVLDVNQVKWRTGLCDKCYNLRPKNCQRCSSKLERSRMEWQSGLCTKCVSECNKNCRDCNSEIPLGSLHWSTSLCDRCYDRYDKMCRHCRQRLEPHLRIHGTCLECRDQCTQLCQMCRRLFLPNQVHWDTGMCDKCYDQCTKVCCHCNERIPFGQLKWGTGLCDTCYVGCEKTCRVCYTSIEFQQLRWGTRMCNPCFDKCNRTCQQCHKKLELGELYWGTGQCNTCFDQLNRLPLPPKQELKAGVKAAIWSQLIFYMAPGILQPSLYLKLQASTTPGRAAQSYSLVLATASIAAMVAPVPLGAWASNRGEKEVYVGVCLLGALAALILALPVNVPIFALGWALLTFPPAIRGVRATFFAKNVDPTELSRAGQLASTCGLIGGFLGPVASIVANQAFGEPCKDQAMDGFVFSSILSMVLLLLSAAAMAITFEVPLPKTRSQNLSSFALGSPRQDIETFEEEKCERCGLALSLREMSYGTKLCDKCFDTFGGENVNFRQYWKTLLIVFCVIAALLEFSMNAGVIATFQPIVVEHFNWGNDLIAAVNVLGTGLSMGVSFVVAQWRLGEREQAAGAAGLYLMGVLAFTFPPLQDWRLVLGMMLGVKAQILFMAPFTAVFSNLIGAARVTNFLTTTLCLAPAIGAALGTLAAPLFVEVAGTPAFTFATVPALIAIALIIAGWNRVRPAGTTAGF
mmetsp:Transcript_63068/g.117325  ORF Transcript_63068/g.117325 Transcript_63068/m.117325 type:complete len:933 (-) Transcript_63068:45-2843(-)